VTFAEWQEAETCKQRMLRRGRVPTLLKPSTIERLWGQAAARRLNEMQIDVDHKGNQDGT
jgi:hypothetical protein